MKDTRNIKDSINTTDIITAINLHCRSAIDNYKNGNIAWKVDLEITKVLFETITYEGFKKDAHYEDAYAELEELTNFIKLWDYSGIVAEL